LCLGLDNNNWEITEKCRINSIGIFSSWRATIRGWIATLH
jgi:hypothetical protein